MLHWLLTMKNVNAESEMKNGKRQISQVARQHFPPIDYPAAAEVIESIANEARIEFNNVETICS